MGKIYTPGGGDWNTKKIYPYLEVHAVQLYDVLEVEVELVLGEDALLPLAVLRRDDVQHHHVLVVRFNLNIQKILHFT